MPLSTDWVYTDKKGYQREGYSVIIKGAERVIIDPEGNTLAKTFKYFYLAMKYVDSLLDNN